MIESISLVEQIKCIERELALRASVYKKRIAEGKMSVSKAEREMATMRAVLYTLQALKEQEP